MKKKQRIKTEIILKVIIVVCLTIGVGFLSYSLIKSTVISIKIGKINGSFSIEQLIPLESTESSKELVENDTIVPPKLKEYLSASSENIDEAVGELSIPSVGIWAPIFSGLKQEQLLFGVGIFDPSRKFEEDNVVIFGHHLSNTGLLLGSLDKVQLGDHLNVRTYDMVHQYKIIEKKVVHESEVEVLDNKDTSHLTLITCDVPDLTAYRIVVVAQNMTEYKLIKEPNNPKDFNFKKEKEQKDKKNQKDMLKYNVLPLIGVLFLLSLCIYCILRYL